MNKYHILVVILVIVVAGIVWLVPNNNVDALTCDQQVRDKSVMIEALNHCQTADDCLYTEDAGDLNCGCPNFVNVNEDLSEIIDLRTNYRANCVDPDIICESCFIPSKDDIRCQQGKCVVLS